MVIKEIFELILTSSTIDKKLEIYTKLEIELEINKNLEYELEIDKNLENFESNFEFFVNFEFYFEFFVISSFLSMVDELTISLKLLFVNKNSKSAHCTGYSSVVSNKMDFGEAKASNHKMDVFQFFCAFNACM